VSAAGPYENKYDSEVYVAKESGFLNPAYRTQDHIMELRYEGQPSVSGC
jgi:hypothetical protein